MFLFYLYDMRKWEEKNISKRQKEIKCGDMLIRKYIGDYNVIRPKGEKPFLEGFRGYFNISHSNDYIALCVSDKEIGIDIEKIRNIDEKIKKRIFTENEIIYTENDETKEKFFEIWTKKESYQKYLGKSVFDNLNKIEILKLEGIKFTQKRVEDYIINICEKEV